MFSGQSVIVPLVLLAVCVSTALTTDEDGSSNAHNIVERSVHTVFDGDADTLGTAPDQEHYQTALKAKNQYGDIRDEGFGGFLHKTDQREFFDGETLENNAMGNPLNLANGKTMSQTAVNSQTPLISKRFNEFVGKRSPDDHLGPAQETDIEQESFQKDMEIKDMMRRIYAILRSDAMKRQYEFVGKKSYDFVGKRSYDFVGKRLPYDFIGKRYEFVGKRRPYDFLGKKSYDFLGKRMYDFLGKRAPYEFVGKRLDGQGSGSDGHIMENGSPKSEAFAHPPFSAGKHSEENKRYSEFLGKRKRAEEVGEAALSDTQRLAVVLQNNGLRKRLSRMLLNQRLAQQYPEFVGK